MRLDELLGAYALDAVDDDERRAVEQYLLVQPACPRRGAGAPRGGDACWRGPATPPPTGCGSASPGSSRARRPTPAGELAAVLAFDPAATRQAAGGGHGRAGRRRFAGGVAAWLGAAAAAAIVAVIAVGVVGRPRRRSRPRSRRRSAAARSDRDSSTATLRSSDGTVGADAVIDRDGHGYLLADDAARAAGRSHVPAVGRDRRQGDLPRRARQCAAHRDVHRRRPGLHLVITNEVAGGVISDGNPDGAFLGELG